MSALAVERVQKLLKKLGWNFRDLNLYREALIHSSYAHEADDRLNHNERLEYLGDSVLELVVSDYLFKTYPLALEGDLTKLRAKIVCEKSLARIALRLGLGQYLYLGKGEAASGGDSRPSILADAVEALIGALFLDQGYRVAHGHVLSLLGPIFEMWDREGPNGDYKTLIQEHMQSRYSVTPRYRIISAKGPDHDKVFIAQIRLHRKVIGTGSGKTKKSAEQAAARFAWEALEHDR
ncbi:MAG: ribonuclease III [Firmicutes bacterium]|nr:ribonuclease III [Bacillota bacterium]